MTKIAGSCDFRVVRDRPGHLDPRIRTTTPSPPCDEGGSLPKSASIDMWQEACGRFQGYLQRRLQPHLRLAEQATEENLEGFHQHLLACGCTGHTILNYFNHLRMALERMHPGQSFKFITHPNGIPLRKKLDMTKRDIVPPELDVLIGWVKNLFCFGPPVNRKPATAGAGPGCGDVRHPL